MKHIRVKDVCIGDIIIWHLKDNTNCPPLLKGTYHLCYMTVSDIAESELDDCPTKSIFGTIHMEYGKFDYEKREYHLDDDWQVIVINR